MKSTTPRYENLQSKVLPYFYKFDNYHLDQLALLEIHSRNLTRVSFDSIITKQQISSEGDVPEELKLNLFKNKVWEKLKMQEPDQALFFIYLIELFVTIRFTDVLKNNIEVEHIGFFNDPLKSVLKSPSIPLHEVIVQFKRLQANPLIEHLCEKTFTEALFKIQYKHYFCALLSAMKDEINADISAVEIIQKINPIAANHKNQSRLKEVEAFQIKNMQEFLHTVSKTAIDFYNEWKLYDSYDDLPLYDTCIEQIVKCKPNLSSGKLYQIKRAVIWELAKYSGKKISKYAKGPDDTDFIRAYSKRMNQLKKQNQ